LDTWFSYVLLLNEQKDESIKLENAAIFQQHNLTLSDINFETHEGEFVCLIGQTGAGKSSLLQNSYVQILKLERGMGEDGRLLAR
jgi:ABC-type cobalamin/Fe3+-siderophores transport system ATPase subunit